MGDPPIPRDLFTEEETNLLPPLGVYGVWLLKHGHQLPQDQKCVQNLMSVHRMYHVHPDNPTLGMLMGAIDCVIRDLNWEPTGDYYPRAFQDLIEHRRDQKDKEQE